MSLNSTPSGERVHVGFFGVRNAGKSSLVNAVTGQDLAVVSDVAGTTTDPVRKAMELLPVGPVLIVDTPGIDDEGELGALRVKKALRALDSTDVAVLAVDMCKGPGPVEDELVAGFKERNVPYVVAWTKADAAQAAHEGVAHAARALPTPTLPGGADGEACPCAFVTTSALEGWGIVELKEAIASLGRDVTPKRRLVSDLLQPGDVAVLVVPIDSAAPKGRLILPQQQVVRDCIEAGAIACVTSVEALADTLETLSVSPRLVVTDSQVFGQVARIVPEGVPLTSFSILMARYKGTLPAQMAAIGAIGSLADGDGVLIAEGCTHHRQCEDIGTVKLPRWIRQISGAEPRFDFTAGGEFPDDVSAYRVVVHCGGCMLNAREMEHRADVAGASGVPFTNYGMVIAEANGVLERTLAPLVDVDGLSGAG